MTKNSKSAGSRTKPRQRIMRSFKMHEISGVDVPAQEGAVALIMKRKGDPGYDPKSKKGKNVKTLSQSQKDDLEKSAALTTEDNGHTHLLGMNAGFDGSDITAGETTWQDDHTHPWIRTPGGPLVIGMARDGDGRPHTHQIAVMSKNEPANKAIKKETTTMAEENTPTVEELQAQLARVNSIAALTDAEKSYFNSVDEAAQTEFLSKSTDERIEIVTKAAEKVAAAEKTAKAAAAEDDAVLYTTIDGVELRKSAGPAFIAMAKSNDALRKRLDESEDIRANDALEKRAEADLAHIPGDVKVRAAMLKAIDGIEDKSQREAALAALKAQNEAMSKAFETAGSSTAPAPGSPDDELEKLAKDYMAKNAGISIEQASSAVLETPAGRELYKRSVN